MTERVFFHIPGRANAKRDFPRTVFAKVPLNKIEAGLPLTLPGREAILSKLRDLFPQGEMNCWGAPVGAISTMKHMRPGDTVLLLESFAVGSDVGAVGQVAEFWPVELPELSQVLWGESRFPYIFFFNADRISLTWEKLKSVLQYGAKYRTSDFVLVKSERIAQLGGAAEVLRQVLQLPETMTASNLANEIKELKAEAPDVSVVEFGNALKEIAAQTTNPVPSLTDVQNMVTTTTTRAARRAAFRYEVRQAYAGRCAMCGSKLHCPNGKLEGQAAHIYPKEKHGADDVRNGLFLCRLHHWAFDVGWLSISDELKIISRPLPDTHDFAAVRSVVGKSLAEPLHVASRPHPLFVSEHRKLHGF